MISKILTAFFTAAYVGFVLSQVTHMPQVSEPTLAPDVLSAMKKPQLDTTGCMEESKDYWEKFIALVVNAYRKKIYGTAIVDADYAEISNAKPCGNCRLLDIKGATVDVIYFKQFPYKSDGAIVDELVQFHPKFHFECTSCRLRNDEGQELVGGIDLIWHHPLPRIMAYQPDSSDIFIFNGTKILLTNATNANRKNVEGRCFGSDAFKVLCQRTHESGELDHVLHASVDALMSTREAINRLTTEVFNPDDVINCYKDNYFRSK